MPGPGSGSGRGPGPAARSGWSLAAGLATVALAVLQVVALARGGGGAAYVVVLLAAGAVTAAGAATGVVRRNSFEARFAAVLVAALLVVGTAVALLVGLPGRPPEPLGPVPAAVLVAGCLVPALLAVDALVSRG